MRTRGLRGIVRGPKGRATMPDPAAAAACPLDRVSRRFKAPGPNALWVSDFTCVATWAGFVYVAFVIDADARRSIVGWRVSRTAPTSFGLDALAQALRERRPVQGRGLVRHSDRGSPYLALPTSPCATPSGSPGRASSPRSAASATSYDNALAETIDGWFRAEVIHRRGPRRSFEAVEFATLEGVDRFNARRLLEPLGHGPPAEAEARSYARAEVQALAA